MLRDCLPFIPSVDSRPRRSRPGSLRIDIPNSASVARRPPTPYPFPRGYRAVSSPLYNKPAYISEKVEYRRPAYRHVSEDEIRASRRRRYSDAGRYSHRKRPSSDDLQRERAAQNARIARRPALFENNRGIVPQLDRHSSQRPRRVHFDDEPADLTTRMERMSMNSQAAGLRLCDACGRRFNSRYMD